MAVSKNFAGSTYQIPQNKDPKSTNWGTQVSNFLQALADYALPRTGGSNQLTAEMNFSGGSFAGTYGVKLPYIKAARDDSFLPAAGVVRLGNADTVQWKGSSSDLSLAINGSDRLLFNSTLLYQPADAATANTASKLVLRDASGNFSAGTITATSFVGSFSGTATTADKWTNARTITLGSDLSGSVSIDGSANVTLNATIEPNSVALGTDTTGNYVATIAGTTNQVSVTGSGSETAAVTLSLPQDIATTSSPQFADVSITNAPTTGNHATNKTYVDNVAAGFDVKPSVKAATTANITLSGTQTIDGIALSVNDRCLVKNQSTQANNGIYVVASSSWTRATDMDSWTEVPGAFCFVEQGTTLAETGWVCTADQGGTLGSTAITFSQFSGVGAYQPLDATLTSLAAMSTSGFVAYASGTDTATPRTLTGTANKITITNTTGGGDPVFNIGSDVVTLTDTQTLTNKTTVSSTSASTGALKLPTGTTAERPTAVEGYVRYNSDTTAFEGYAAGAWSAIGGGGTVDRVTQASHGFSVGNILYLNGATYTKAIATAANTAEVVGMVSRVVDTNNFEITLSGEVTGLSSLTAGTVYFLSDSSAGAYTATEPTTLGYVSVPLGVASSTTSFYVAPKRGSVIGGTNARTSLSLANNSTNNIQDVSAYDAGEITGWISITATTPLKFYVSAPFAKNGAGTNWNISPAFMGDTPPSGFAISITSAGVIQYTMPSVTGFSAATINYALNAPAVGATFPLSVSGSSIVNGTPTVDTINEYTSTNGVQIKGRTSGTAIAAGYVGEKGIQTNSFQSSQACTTTYADYTGSASASAAISLTAGRWLILANLTLDVQTAASSGATAGGYAKLVDGSGTLVELQEKQFAIKATSAVANQSSSMLAFACIVNPTSTTTYKIQIKKAEAGGTATVAFYNTATSYSEFFAIRIA